MVRLSRGPGLLCGQRIDKGGCSQPAGFLPILEDQMGAYLKALKLPGDYQERLLAYCQDLETDRAVETEVGAVKARLARIKELYAWGDMGKAEYLTERQQLQSILAKQEVAEAKPDYVGRVAQFLQDLSLAWEAADQEHRNRLAARLFQAVWMKDSLLLAVTPQPDMVPFFDLIYSAAVKDHYQLRPRRGSDFDEIS